LIKHIRKGDSIMKISANRLMLNTVLFIAVCSMLGFISVAHSATLEVGAGKPYTTIQSAIDDSNGGDTVLVYDGTYNEAIDFKGQAITLKSVNGAEKTINPGIS
jgi:hypothetical protein